MAYTAPMCVSWRWELLLLLPPLLRKLRKLVSKLRSVSIHNTHEGELNKVIQFWAVL